MGLAASYSDVELAAIVDYLTRVQDLMRAETLKLRRGPRPAAKRRKGTR